MEVTKGTLLSRDRVCGPAAPAPIRPGYTRRARDTALGQPDRLGQGLLSPAAASELSSEDEVAAFEWLRAAKSYPDVAGSGDKQAKAKLCCVEIDEVTVAFGPPA
jgi:hypothetical protein